MLMYGCVGAPPHAARPPPRPPGRVPQGDVKKPVPETLALLDEYMCDYVTTIAHKASALAKGKATFRVEDVLLCLKQDKRKFARVKELLRKHEAIVKVRKLDNRGTIDEEEKRQKRAKEAA